MEAIVYKNNIKLLICGQSKLQNGKPVDRWINWIDIWMVQWIDGWIDQCID